MNAKMASPHLIAPVICAELPGWRRLVRGRLRGSSIPGRAMCHPSEYSGHPVLFTQKLLPTRYATSILPPSFARTVTAAIMRPSTMTSSSLLKSQGEEAEIRTYTVKRLSLERGDCNCRIQTSYPSEGSLLGSSLTIPPVAIRRPLKEGDWATTVGIGTNDKLPNRLCGESGSNSTK